MRALVRIAVLVIIIIGFIFSCCGVNNVLAAPANAISNELRATIQVQPGQTSVTFDLATMTLEPGFRQTSGYNYRSTVNDWLTTHVASIAVEGAAVSADQVQFITFEDGPGSAVQWQGYSITEISGAVITAQGQIGDNLRVTSAASARVTITALLYNGNVYELNQALTLNVEINPYFSGTGEELNANQAVINVADSTLTIAGLKKEGGSAFSLPPGALVYRLFQPQEGLTPENPALSQSMNLTSDSEIIEQQNCKVSKRWPSGRHDIYIADGSSLYRLTLTIDHLSHDANQAVSYLKAGNDVLIANAVRLSWAEGQDEVPVHTITCGQAISLPVQVWATEPLAVKLVATWDGGTANYEVDLVQGNNAGVVFPITFQQPGNFDISIYAELR